MNNLLPSSVALQEKYDLKGSTYKRKASAQELSKASPTLKDLDFRDLHREGLKLEAETYAALLKTIDRDVRVRRVRGFIWRSMARSLYGILSAC